MPLVNRDMSALNARLSDVRFRAVRDCAVTIDYDRDDTTATRKLREALRRSDTPGLDPAPRPPGTPHPLVPQWDLRGMPCRQWC